MISKQSIADRTQQTLRERTAHLTTERARLTAYQKKASERKALRDRIANLRRANSQQRALLGLSPDAARTDVKVGEADAGLEIDTSLLPPLASTPDTHPLTLTPQQRTYISHLPTAAVLRARASAYRKTNERLEAQAKALKCQSSEVETMLRKVVGLCTGVGEEGVDGLVGSLWKAVESEQGDEVDVGRVRDFLRRVEGVEG